MTPAGVIGSASIASRFANRAEYSINTARALYYVLTRQVPAAAFGERDDRHDRCRHAGRQMLLA